MTIDYNRGMFHQPFKRQQSAELEKKALLLYRQGLTTREVGKIIGRSHQWVAIRVKKLSTPTAIDKDLPKD